MTPLLLALGASLAWGVADFVGPLVGRTLGTLPVLFWAQIGGVVAIAIAVAARGDGPRGYGVLFAIGAAVGGMLGLDAYYRGMVTGAMSVVAPIAGVSAIIPVCFGIATGDSPSAPQIAGVVCALVGVGLASVEHHEGTRRVAAGVGLALLAACGFGFYFPWMHAAGKVDFWWASLVFRTTALLLVTAVVAVRRSDVRLRPQVPRDRRRVGIGDTIGNVLFAASSGHGLVSLTAVLASLYPDRDGGARSDRPARAGRAATTARHRADARGRRADLRLKARTRVRAWEAAHQPWGSRAAPRPEPGLAGREAKRGSRCSARKKGANGGNTVSPVVLDVEADVQDVAVADDVGLSLEPLLALLRDLGVRAELDEVVPVDDLAADEPARDVRVDRARPRRARSRRCGASTRASPSRPP